MGFKQRPTRYRKELLTDQGAGVRVRGSRKECITGNLGVLTLPGVLATTLGTNAGATGFISLFVTFYDQSVDQNIFTLARSHDRGVVGRQSTGLSCYLEGGKLVVYHIPFNVANGWWRVVCNNAVPNIQHIHIQSVGTLPNTLPGSAPFLIWINNEPQPVTYTQGGSTAITVDWNYLYIGSQKEFGHDFLLKTFLFGRRCTDSQRQQLYNNGRGLSYAQTIQQLGSNLNLYVDWTKPMQGGFNANLVTGPYRHLSHFPGFTPEDLADGLAQYTTLQNGPSQILPHAKREIDYNFANFIYPDCKPFFRYGDYRGRFVQSNGSTEMPQHLGQLDISFTKHGSVTPPAVAGIPDAGSIEITTITNSPLRYFYDTGNTPVGFSEVRYETALTTMTLFSVSTSRKNKLTFTLKTGVAQCIVDTFAADTNFLDQTFSSLYDSTKVLVKDVDVSVNPKLVGTIPNQYNLLTNFKANDTGLTTSPTAGWGTSTVKASVYLYGCNMAGTHLLVNVNDFLLSNSSTALAGTQQATVFNSGSPTTTANIVDMRPMVAGTTNSVNLSGANVYQLFMPTTSRVFTSLAFANNPNMLAITNLPTSGPVVANGGSFTAYNCGPQPTYLLGTVFPARTISIGQMPQAAFEASITNLFNNTGNLADTTSAKHLNTFYGESATGANMVPSNLVTNLLNHCLNTNTTFVGWTPAWPPTQSVRKRIHPVRSITQPPANYSINGVTGNNQRIIVQTSGTSDGIWPVAGTVFYLTNSTGGNATMNGAWMVLGRYTSSAVTTLGNGSWVVMERQDGSFNNTFTTNELALISAQLGT